MGRCRGCEAYVVMNGVSRSCNFVMEPKILFGFFSTLAEKGPYRAGPPLGLLLSISLKFVNE